MEKYKNKISINVILILACVFLSICALCISLIISRQDIKTTKNDNWIIKEVQTDTTTNTERSFMELPKWEKLSISEQFSSFNYNNNKYMSRRTKIERENIENKIGNETLTSIDPDSYYEYYSGSENVNIHSKKAELFSIKNISKECAIAVKFDEDSDYYVFVQSYYKPATLGEFMEDLNLKELTSFGTVSYDYIDTGEYIEVEFYNVDNEIIWNKLFSNGDLSMDNAYTPEELISTDKYKSKNNIQEIGISVDIPLLGYKNIGIELTDKGYLITNILDSEKCFYIGENTVKEFFDYIKENYEGYKIDRH